MYLIYYVIEHEMINSVSLQPTFSEYEHCSKVINTHPFEWLRGTSKKNKHHLLSFQKLSEEDMKYYELKINGDQVNYAIKASGR